MTQLQKIQLYERNKVQDCVWGYSNHENVPLSSPADGKVNTHSYENVPLGSPAVGKINIGYLKHYIQNLPQLALQHCPSHGLLKAIKWGQHRFSWGSLLYDARRSFRTVGLILKSLRMGTFPGEPSSLPSLLHWLWSSW